MPFPNGSPLLALLPIVFALMFMMRPRLDND